MASLVIDCSITMPWCFADEATPMTDAVQNRLAIESAIVPAIWPFEVANVLTIAERRKRISVGESSRFLQLLGTLLIEVDTESSSRSFAHLLPLSRAHGLTVYDAAYLDLAHRCSLPLATLDTALIKAAKRVGVTVLGP
jgi:predicted nucleic acid-binding protein